MRVISRVYYNLSVRRVLTIGAIIFLVGVASRIGVFYYGRNLAGSLLQEMEEIGGTSIEVSDAMLRICIGNFLSSLVMLAGGVIVILGVAKQLLMPFLKPQGAEQAAAPNR